jgi:hypothetical protein
MRLVLVTFSFAVLIGYLTGGRLSALAGVKVRWPATAMIGLALQFAPVPGKTLPLMMLWVSFGSLFVFAIANIRVVGFPLIAIGIVLNFTVIAVDHGMPVTREALVASHQQDTLQALLNDGGAKHHLSGSSDHLLFLGDVTAVPPIRQIVSIGDVLTYLGVMLLIIGGMRGRASPAVEMPEVQRVGD